MTSNGGLRHEIHEGNTGITRCNLDHGFDAELPNLLDWYIQAGSQRMVVAAAGNEILLGDASDMTPSGKDTLYGVDEEDNDWNWRMAA